MQWFTFTAINAHCSFQMTAQKQTDFRPKKLRCFFFVERDEERARKQQQEQTPFGAPVKYDLFGTGQKLAYRDTVFSRYEDPTPQSPPTPPEHPPLRMSADSRTVGAVLEEVFERLLRGFFEFRQAVGRRERSGRESLLIYSRRPYWYEWRGRKRDEDRMLTFVADWGDKEERVLWETEVPAKKDAAFSNSNILGSVIQDRFVIGGGYVGMLSTAHDNDVGHEKDDSVWGEVSNMRLRLFSKEDGLLIGEHAMNVPDCGDGDQYGSVLFSASREKVLALCTVRDRNSIENRPICRIECYVYDAAYALRRRGGRGSDKSIPRRKVSLKHPLLWEEGPRRDDFECTFRCGSILVLYMRNSSLSVWDLGGGPEAILLSSYETNRLDFHSLSRDESVWIFHEEYEEKWEKLLVVALHKSLGVLGETT